MRETYLTEQFVNADESAADITVQPQVEQVAFNLHDALTRFMAISPSSAAGVLNGAGQMMMLLSSAKVPDDALRGSFNASVAGLEVTAERDSGAPVIAAPKPNSDFTIA
jgi:hypothetical protein